MNKIIVFINEDKFEVDKEEFEEMQHRAKIDWVKLVEWIEQHGTLITDKK